MKVSYLVEALAWLALSVLIGITLYLLSVCIIETREIVSDTLRGVHRVEDKLDITLERLMDESGQ